MINLPNPPQLDNMPVKSIIIGLIVLSTAIVTVLFGLDYLEERNLKSEEEQQAINQKITDEIARQIASGLAPIRAQLRHLASDQQVIDLMQGSEQLRREKAGELSAAIDGSLLLRILPVGTNQFDRTQSPPLTFASMDMLRIATESKKQVPLESHLGGTANEHLVMIERVFADQELIGFLHLSLTPHLVSDAIAAFSPKDGYLEVRQRAAGGPPVVIARHGQPQADQSMSLLSTVPGTAFLALYRIGSGKASSAGSATSLSNWLLPAGVVGILCLGGLMLSRRKSFAKPAAVKVEYAGAIRAILDNSQPGLAELLPGGIGKFPEPGEVAAADDTSPQNVPSGLDLDFDLLSEPASEASNTINPIDQGPPVAGIEVAETTTEELATLVPTKIFRSYDIRGVVGESLTPDGVYQIGRALGSEALERGQQTVVVARDGRNSSQELRDGLIEGLRDSGRDVLDIGLTPTPILYFATNYLDSHSGVMVTGSHNPPEYNGLKIVLDGETLSGEAIQAIRERVETQNYTNGEGTMQTMEIIPDYIRRVGEEVPVTFDALKVVVDCANSVPGIVVPHILRAIGHDVVELFCEVDGDFPNHHPDPSQPENLTDLIEAVQREDADIGLAFDGDGDRLGVVDNEGNIIWPDKQLMLFARDVLKNNPGAKVIYDVKCSHHLAKDITAHGGEPIMSQTGHSIIKNKMQQEGALLAGDLSGHIFFKDRWYGFDDALYSAARLLEILVESERPSAEVFGELPGGVVTPEIRINMPEEEHAAFMEQVIATAKLEGAELTTLDGLRADYHNSWGLIRPSNTTPSIIVRFEGDDEGSLEEVKSIFRSLIKNIDETIDLPF